jgi:hypothetical protein
MLIGKHQIGLATTPIAMSKRSAKSKGKGKALRPPSKERQAESALQQQATEKMNTGNADLMTLFKNFTAFYEWNSSQGVEEHSSESIAGPSVTKGPLREPAPVHLSSVSRAKNSSTSDDRNTGASGKDVGSDSEVMIVEDTSVQVVESTAPSSESSESGEESSREDATDEDDAGDASADILSVTTAKRNRVPKNKPAAGSGKQNVVLGAGENATPAGAALASKAMYIRQAQAGQRPSTPSQVVVELDSRVERSKRQATSPQAAAVAKRPKVAVKKVAWGSIEVRDALLYNNLS